MKVNIDKDEIISGFLVGVSLAVLATAISTYIEVKTLRHDVDRIEVYVDQLWKQK